MPGHPTLAAALVRCAPLAEMDVTFPRAAEGPLELRMTGYAGPADLPDELVLSVRCIVAVGDRYVLCTNPDVTHAWPGGRREPGKTYADTAVREVYEETGYRLDPESLVELGWLHFVPRRDPRPEFLQVVFAGRASGREREDWTDLDGYETASTLVTPGEAAARLAGHPACAAFFERATRALS